MVSNGIAEVWDAYVGLDRGVPGLTELVPWSEQVGDDVVELVEQVVGQSWEAERDRLAAMPTSELVQMCFDSGSKEWTPADQELFDRTSGIVGGKSVPRSALTGLSALFDGDEP